MVGVRFFVPMGVVWRIEAISTLGMCCNSPASPAVSKIRW